MFVKIQLRREYSGQVQSAPTINWDRGTIYTSSIGTRMDVHNISGPGVGRWLAERLISWGIQELTEIQARSLEAGIADGRSMVVSAPTSTGKTLVGEIAVLSALRSGIKAIYLVSHKALADQKYRDFEGRFGDSAPDPIASVGLSTGDRTEGDIDARLTVATYEKALGLILTGQLNPSDALVVADELQILGERGRGPDIEALCAVFRQRGLKQFVALTATVENPGDIADWMRCGTTSSGNRDVPLHQEIWYGDQTYRVTFGDDTGAEIGPYSVESDDISSVVSQLLKAGRGPVLVFTESRREAVNYATAFRQNRPRVGEGIALAEQLDLFSEPTESSASLRENAERRVIFHTADLSPQERRVVEEGFIGSKFEACFATSTLAAGVNFPFRTVVFPKLTFQWGDRAGSMLPLSDYRNMSGRAGRLGMHADGFAVLLPRNTVELAHANNLVLPANSRVDSQLIKLSLRKTILTLVACRLVANFDGLMKFFRNTLYWHQTLDRNPEKLKQLEAKSRAAINWLIENELLKGDDGSIFITPLGQGVALSGLLPTSAVQLSVMLKKIGPELANSFDGWAPGLVYAICSSEEFRGDTPSRFLPYPGPSQGSSEFWRGQKTAATFDHNDAQVAQSAHAIVLFASGLAERKIAFATGIPSGSIHRLSIDIAWMLDGLHKLACVPELACSQNVSNQIAMLARMVRWGAPAEALDIMRVAERYRVPGFGRQRAMALVSIGITSIHHVLEASKEKLTKLLRNNQRVEMLLEAASTSVGNQRGRLSSAHKRTAKELGIESIVDSCEKELGTKYETAIFDLLSVETAWVVTILDNGDRQNVPDLLIQLGDLEVLLECKTCSKTPALIKKEEAWAVLQKSADYASSMRRVTLGKPAFDETAKKKAGAAVDITLVEHSCFVEGMLRVHSGRLDPSEFLSWLATPGVSEIDRLGGTPTFVVR